MASPPRPDRRRFLALLASATAGSVALPATLWGGAAVLVEAQPTPLFAPPDGRRCLVRFFVTGLDAPAGRLRVFAAGRLLGTAGVVPLGDGRLYGELWLTLGATPQFRTELTAPGLGAPVVHWHAPPTAPRWTIYWAPLLPAAALEQRLASLGQIPRTVLATDARRSGARLDPLPATIPATTGDMPFLRLAEPALRLSLAADVPLATVGTADASALAVPTLATVLAGSGVRAVLVRDAAPPGIYRLSGPDGSRVLALAQDPDADAGQLGFFDGGPHMVQMVEQFLQPDGEPGETAGPSRVVLKDGATAVALVSGAAADRLGDAAAALEDWTTHFAYPRIAAGDAAAFLAAVEQREGLPIAPWDARAHAPPAAPSLAEASAVAAARAEESAHRANELIACLARLLPGGYAGLDAIAHQLALPVPGTLVFNPAPYPRTEPVTLVDGSERVVTDLPPLGYAYFPLGAGGGAWTAAAGAGRDPVVETAQFRVALDPDSGAIRSLVSAGDGREWVRPGVLGLNEMDGAQLVELTRASLAGVGVRVEALRRSPEFGIVRSTLTLYDHLPRIDLVNDAAATEQRAVRYRFAFALETPDVQWEVPAGADRAPAPVDLRHLRWVRLAASGGSASLGAREAAAASVDGAGTLTSYAPRGPAHYRIAVGAPGAFERPDDPWRFGWGMEPLLTARVPGTGAARLPSFGRLLVIDQPGVAIVGAQWARGGDGVVVYLQELAGQQRVATLGAGLLGWTSARQVDLAERDLSAPAMTIVNGAAVTLKPHGLAALKLLGLRLAQG